jgi:hypothetical protein
VCVCVTVSARNFPITTNYANIPNGDYAHLCVTKMEISSVCVGVCVDVVCGFVRSLEVF